MTDKINSIVERILNSKCTPVIGAGISFDSPLDDEDKKFFPQNTPNMIKILFDACCKREQEKCKKDELDNNCHIYKEKEQQRLEKLCERFVWNEDVDKYKSLAEILSIHKFDKIIPSKAHYCMAFLAREGLLNEIITTNYDCCFERAYKETWCNSLDDSEKDKSFEVIHDAESNTENSAKAYFGNNKDIENENELGKKRILKIYKINGCAKYANEEKKRETLLLTSTQLQDWRKRTWAADFFRHKLRTTSLLFSAFGSDEPQIIHTIEKVFEEEIVAKNDKNGNLLEKANVPFVQIYEKNPSFPQEYIARRYAELHGNIKDYENLLVSCEDFGEQNNLSADFFWSRIFFNVFERLIKDALYESSKPGKAAFVSAVPNATEILKDLSDKYEIAYEKDGMIPKTQKDLVNIVCHNKKECKSKTYFTVVDHQELYAEFIFLINLLDAETKECIADGHLKLDIEDNKFCSVCDHFHRSDKKVTQGNQTCLQISEFVIGSKNFFNEAARYRRKDAGNILDVIQFSWQHLFDSIYDRDMSENEVKERIKDAAKYPSKYLARNRKSYKKSLEKYKVEVAG